MDVFTDIFTQLTQLRKEHDLSHIGTVPGLWLRMPYVIWGLRFPDRALLMYFERGEFAPVGIEVWREHTGFPPPWPWDGNGPELLVPQ